MTSNTPDMGLRIWDTGVDYFTYSDLAYNWSRLSQHDHSPGNGIPIDTDGIENLAITSPKIAPASVHLSHLHADALTGAVADGAVTNPKVAPGANIDPTKIAGTAVVNADSRLSDPRTPAPNSVTDASVANGAISPNKVNGTAVVTTDARFATVASRTVTSSATFAATDAGGAVDANSASAIVLTVPTNATVSIPVGTIIFASRLGAGTVSIAAASGVTIVSEGSKLNLKAQGNAVALRKTATDTWLLTGQLS